MAYKKSNPNGQATMANSEPVVIASDQSAVPVSGTFYQATQPVSAASLPLPTGASTSANQTTIIEHLDGVEGLLTTIDADTGAIATSAASIDTKTPALGQALAGASVPVVLTAAQEAALTPPAAITGFATSAKQDTIIGHVDGIETVLGTMDADTSNISTKIDTLAGAVAGTEVQVDIVAALPAGTNAIGKLAANSGVDIGDVDVTSLPALPPGTNAVGKLLPPDVDVTGHTNYARKYYTSTGAATDGIIWSPAAGKRWHVTSLYINVSAAATVTLEDDKAAGDDPVFKSEFAANSGVFLTFPEKYPLASGEDAADLLITTSAGNVYVTAVGYEI